MFVDTDEGRRELGGFIDRAFAAWSGKPGTSAPGRAGIDLLVAMLAEPFEIKPMLRTEIADGDRETVRLTDAQLHLLHMCVASARPIIGGAGTGKTMLAVEKARQLAREGFRTLLVCFNSALAGMLAEEVENVARETGFLEVKTFHQLCEDLGREAGVLGPVPCRPAGLVGRDASSGAG